MHHTQKTYAAAKTVFDTISDKLFKLDRDWTEAESIEYQAAGAAYREATGAMISWAMAEMQRVLPASQWNQIKDLPAQCEKNFVRTQKLAGLAFRFVA